MSDPPPTPVALRVRVCLCTSPRGMDAERDWLRQHVLPALRQWCAQRGVDLELVEPDAPGGSVGDVASLRQYLDAVEQCRPFFLAVLGDSYGAPLGPLLAEAVGAHAPAAAHPEWSPLHLAVWQAVLRDPRWAEHGFFYVRDPQFLGRVPEEHRRRFVGDGPDEAPRVAALLAEIRASGRPVREYPCGWDESGGSPSGLAEFGERVLDDLRDAVTRELARAGSQRVPATAAPDDGPQPGAAPFSPLDENVQFTAYRPKAIRPGRWYPLLAFAHLAERPPDAAEDEPDPVEEVQRQARQVLGEQAREYQEVTQDSQAPVPRLGEITFLPELPGVEFNPPRRTFRWQEPVHREEFRMRASPALDGKVTRGRLSVFLGSILLADISLSVRVDSGRPAEAPDAERSQATPYGRIFPSYSHRDEEIVRQFEQYAQTLGHRFLRDCTELRAGEVWNDKLMRLIEEADIFQLFWSHNSMRSPFVRQEWERALALRRPEFVRPVYWQEPMPTAPAEGLPPDHLRCLHFQRIFVARPPGPGPSPGDAGGGGVPPDRPKSDPPRPPRGMASRLQRGGGTLTATKGKAEGSTRLAGGQESGKRFNELKQVLHHKLVDKLDLSRVSDLGGDTLRREIRLVVERLCDTEDPLLNRTERETVIEEVLDETFGFGPLEVLLKDPTISDILVNGPHKVYVERRGTLEKTDVQFRDSAHLSQIIDRIVSKVGRRVDETSPMVDARLPDGSRVNAVIPPLALDGPVLCIRRPGTNPLKLEDLLDYRALTPEMALFLEACVKAHLNVVISGGAGGGKTTLLNTLASFIGPDERVVTVEDAAELQLQQDHVIRLEARPPNVEGRGEVTTRDLVRNALRMRPERVIVGECRGPEARDVLQAMTTGHAGSMTTLHATTPQEALERLETMTLMAGLEVSVRAVRQQISSAVDVIIQANRLQGGPRRVTSIAEVCGMEQDIIIVQDVFRYRQLGIDQNGRAFGRFEATGVRPAFVNRIEAAGIELPPDLFAERALLRDESP